MSPSSNQVLLDLNNPEFQRDLFALPKDAQRAVLSTLAKLSRMTWDRVYADPGLRGEAVVSRTAPAGARLYTLRLGKAFRAVAFRQDDWLRLLTLHPDHDSAYR